jgi:hypothetical protein
MYQAIVAKVSVSPFLFINSKGVQEEAKNIQLGNVLGFQVIVGKEIKDGTLGIFFPCDGQLSEEFVAKNDLKKRKDDQGNQVGGMFEENRRVKSIKMKGQKSDGFWCPLSFVEYTGVKTENLHEGYLFTELNGKPICNKYVTQATKQAIAKQKTQTKQRKKNPMCREHVETEQLRYFLRSIPKGSICHITEKEHGTSGRLHCVRDEVSLMRNGQNFSDLSKKIQRKTKVNVSMVFMDKLLDRFVNFYRKCKLSISEKLTKSVNPQLKIDNQPFTYINGTRRTLLEKKDPNLGNGFYGNDDMPFRLKHTKSLEGKLHPGESIYFELVGYVTEDSLIMAKQSIKNLKDKELQKKLGDEVCYTYGCLPGQSRLRVYRITQTSDDNSFVELSWFQVQARAKELGLETVRPIESFMYDGNDRALQSKIEREVDGISGPIMSPIDPRHPQEGIVLRVEAPDGSTKFYKSKSWLFGTLEGYLKDKSDYVDTEESS